MYEVSETVLPIYINGQCPIIKTCSDVTLNLSSKDSISLYFIVCQNGPETYEYSMTFHSVFVNLRKRCALDCCTITYLNEIIHNSPIA